MQRSGGLPRRICGRGRRRKQVHVARARRGGGICPPPRTCAHAAAQGSDRGWQPWQAPLGAITMQVQGATLVQVHLQRLGPQAGLEHAVPGHRPVPGLEGEDDAMPQGQGPAWPSPPPSLDTPVNSFPRNMGERGGTVSLPGLAACRMVSACGWRPPACNVATQWVWQTVPWCNAGAAASNAGSPPCQLVDARSGATAAAASAPGAAGMRPAAVAASLQWPAGVGRIVQCRFKQVRSTVKQQRRVEVRRPGAGPAACCLQQGHRRRASTPPSSRHRASSRHAQTEQPPAALSACQA